MPATVVGLGSAGLASTVVAGRPVGGRPVGGRPEAVGGRSVGGRSVGGRPVGGRSVGGRPVAVAGRPVAGRPVAGTPVVQHVLPAGHDGLAHSTQTGLDRGRLGLDRDTLELGRGRLGLDRGTLELGRGRADGEGVEGPGGGGREVRQSAGLAADERAKGQGWEGGVVRTVQVNMRCAFSVLGNWKLAPHWLHS